MSDETNETSANQPADTPTEAAPALSRRDFLRRAGREAGDVGTRLVPGGAVVRAVMGEPATLSKPAKVGLLARFAEWRNRHNAEPQTTENTNGTPNA